MSEANKQYQVNSNDLITVADAIRLRTGETRDLIFPDEFVVGINSIAGTWRPIHVNGTEILSTDPASGFLNLKIASGSVNILGITATSATGGQNAEFGIRINPTYFSSDAQNGLSLANSWISTLVTNPMQAANDLIIGGTSGAPTRLAGGSVGQVLGIDSSGNIGWLSEAHTGTVTSVTLTQGTGITVSDSGVAITSSGTREISLNIASTSALGGIRVGEGLTATAAGVLSIDSTTATEGDVFIRDTDGFAWTHQYTAYNTSSIPWGKVNTTSTSTLFTATVPGVSAYRDGVSFWLKNGVVTSASGFTININGLGAKKVYSNMAPTTRDTTIFNINYTMLFVYDAALDDGAGAFVCYRGYDANTNTIGYQVRTNNSSVVAQSKFYRYRLLFTSPNGTEWVPANTSTSTNATAVRTTNQAPIDPFGPIVWYGTTTAVDAGAAPGASYLWQQCYSTSLAIGYSFNRTGAAATMTAHLPVYLKCAPQADGSAIIDAETPYVQALPATADGKIYILLGRAVTATCFELLLDHPVYAYINGHVQAWAPYAATAGSAGASTSAIYDGGLNPQQKISEWYGHSISVSGHTLTLEDANGDELNAITLPDDNTTYTLGTGPQTVTLTPSSGSVQSITVPYATSALKDDGGNQITTHYGHILITNGNTIGLEDGNGDEITGSFITVPYATSAGSASSATSAIYDGGLNPTQKISEWYGHSLSLSNGVLALEDANGDSLSTVTLPEGVTYTLGTSGNNVTLTPSTGSVQSITVPYATKALGDDGGNQISTYYGHKLIISGNTLGLEDGNGDEISGSFVTVPYASTAGSVAWANVSGHAAGVKEDLGIAASGTTFLRKDGTWATPTNTWRPIKYDTTTLNDATTTLEFVAGSNIGLTFSAGKLTISSSYTNTTYTLGTNGNTVTLTPSSGSVQSITVPYATNARNDDGGNQISVTYGHALVVSGNTVGLEDGNGDEITGSFVTVPYATAAGSVAWANVSGHAAGVKDDLGIAASGTTFLRKDGTWATPTDTNTTYSLSGALASHKFTTTLTATNPSGTSTSVIEFVAGSNVTLTDDTTNKKITIAATDTTYTLGTGVNTVTLTPSSGSAQSITVPYATAARNDDGGNQISTTYGHSLVVSGTTVGLEDGNGDEITGSFVTVPYASSAGSVAWDNVSGHLAGVKADLGIESSGSTFLRKDGTWATPANTTYTLTHPTGTYNIVLNANGTAQNTITLGANAWNSTAIPTVYLKSASVSGNTLTLTKADDTTVTFSNTNTTYTLGTSGNTVTLTPSSGNAQSITVPYATRALGDDAGNQITTTYGHVLVISGNTVGLEDGNGDAITGSFITIPYATAAGNASTADTANSVAWANVSGHAAGVKSDLGIASSGTTFLRKDGTWATPTDTNTTYAISGALASHKFTTTLTATNPSGTSTAAIEFVAGSNVTLTDDTTNKKITIASANTTYTLGVGTNTVTLTPSSGNVQTITVPYATNARNDDGGNQISTTYAHSLIVSGNTVGLEDGNGDEITGSFVTVPYASSAGSVAWANVDGHLAGVKADLGIESTGSTFLRKDGTWATPANTTYTLSHPANTYNLVLSAGGTAQDTITLGANAWNSTAIPTVYIKSAAVSGSTLTLTKSDNTTVTFSDTDLNTWRPIKYGSTTLSDTATTLEFVAGSNVGLSFSSGKLTISSSYTNTTYTLGTSGNTVTLTPSSGSVQSITVPYATKALGDDGGHQISTHYGHLLVISGNTIGLEDGNGDEITGSFITVPYATAANTATTADSANSVAWANVSGHAAGVKADIGIATTGTTFLRKDGTWATPTDTNTTYAISGALSSHKFTTTLTATNPSGTSTSSLELVAGTNITLTDDTTNRKITIASANTTYTLGTNGNSVTLTPSSGSVQSITVPYATNAKNDDGGNQISTTYGHALIVSGNTVGLEDGNGDEITGSFVTVPYATAAGSVDWANVNGHAAGVKADLGIASSGATFLRKDGQWATPANTTYTLTHPTNTYNLVLNAGGTAQDTITLGANAWNSTAIPTVYIKSASVSGSTLTLTKSDNTTVTFSDTDLNTWRPIKYGSTTLNDKTTTLEFVAGSNVGLSFSSGKLTISSSYTNTTYTLGTNGNTVTLTPSSGSVQSITVPYATKALGDDAGNQITTTYGHALVVSGNTVGLEDGNGDSITGSFVTVPYATAAGSATTATTADTANSVAWANVSGHAAGVKSDLGIATSGSTFLRKDGQWATPTDTNTTYSLSGALSSHKFTTTLTATNPSGTSTSAIEFVAGGNITLTDDTANKKITIAATDTTYTFSAPLSKNSSNVVSLSLGTGLTTSSNALVVDSGWLEDEISDALTGYVKGSGTSGYLAKWNGSGSITNGPQLGSSTTTYLRNDGTWATPPDTNNAVTQTATTTNATYEVLFSNTADNTTRTEGARKNSNLLFNPSTGTMSTVIYTMMVGTTAKARMNYDNTVEAIKFTFV